ncbi:MAG: hypothetical protein ACW98D_12360 [Promethearchaeota archaeon]|jgi:hypothetical protein
MRNNKIKTISLGIIFFICFSNIVNFTPIENFNEVLQISAGEISIVTPENKTYTTSMSGYYPASFGFENDADGSSPEGWDNPTGTGSYLRVVSERFGRKKVIEAYDAGPGTGWWASYYFNKTEGTIEFWWAISSVAPSQAQSVFILNSTGDPLFGVQVISGQIQVLTGGTWLDISGLTITVNTWDHVRLDFRSNSGSSYQGINQNEYRIYYNSIDKGTYSFQNIGDPNNTRLYSGLTPSNVYGYLDAFGFSWDPNYNVGDNLNEGLLLSFENSTQLDWIGYSLDDQANKTIKGNTTFPIPTTGLHSIQVFGSDPIFTMYQSQKVFFTVDYHPINIITPENKTYTGPMDEYYLETYDFENEIDGTSNESIEFIDLNSNGPKSSFEILSNFNDHDKVLKCVDGPGASALNGTHYFNENTSKGIIEFWYAIDNVGITNGMAVRFYSDAGHAWYFSCYQGYFRSNGWVGMGAAIANNWYHIKMVYDCSLDTVDYYIDGVYKRTASFVSSSQVEFMRIDSDSGDSSFTGYIDAFSQSWDENGYYPATYGFENDGVDADPSDFTVWEGGGAVLVRDPYRGHKNVVQIYDTSASDYAGIHNIFDSSQATGTIEAYVSFTHTNKHHEFSIRDGSWSNSIAFSFIDGYLYYYTGGGWVNTGSSFIAYKWYHVKIEFDCSDAWYLWIDGIRIDRGNGFEFNGNPTAMDRAYLVTHNSDANYNYFIDALGYSWDENYNIGDNLHEGLLISYETSKIFNWIGYSLDGKANITIGGNITIPMPRNGLHTLQLFGNDSLGVIHSSGNRYFTMDYAPLNILTPENITYSEPMLGYYPGTYGFEDDFNDAIPKDWINSSGVGYTVKVIDEFNEHKKVVELDDSKSSNFPSLINIFKTPRTVGTIELWVSTTDITKSTYISFKDNSDNTAFYFEIYDEKLKFWYQEIGTSYDTSIVGSNNKWFHLKVEFDCTGDGSVSSWLNGESLVSTVYFQDPLSAMGRIQINTDQTHSAYTSYVDCVGYSWDPNYNVGDNIDEGILLSCENYSGLDWIAYSLSDQIKNPIPGDKVLPIPEDDNHSIQVFGIDLLDNHYESEIEYFSIDIAPFIKWQGLEDFQTVILPPTDSYSDIHAIFDFEYLPRKLHDVKLILDGTDLGTVWENSSVVLSPYTDYTNGYITAVLNGYDNDTVLVASDMLNLKFVKVLNETKTILASNTEVLGAQLYLILHDPHGDNSYSSFSEETTLSFGVGSEITTAIGVSVEIGAEFSLFGAEIGASLNLETKSTVGSGFDFRFEVKDTTSLTSSQVNDNADYIGPGYGDRYWGEAWIYKWVLNATLRSYSNGTTSSWEDPTLYYGILRDVEAFLSDEHAPLEWKNQNAVYNDTLPVRWIKMFQESGGSPYTFEHEVTTTTKRKTSFQIDLGASFGSNFGVGETEVTLEMSVQNYVETSQEIKHKVAYNIEDDDPTDYLVQGIGIDERFGTYIFNTSSFFCETSNPLEHGTYDYLPPIINFPSINLDANNDGTGPTPSDLPIVTVDILDEGGVAQVIVWYSTDGGLNWFSVYLPELVTNPGTWENALPSQPVGTTVLWYIQAFDI